MSYFAAGPNISAPQTAFQQFNPYPASSSQPQQQYTSQAHLYQPQIAPWTQYMRRSAALTASAAHNVPPSAPSGTSPVGLSILPPASGNPSQTKRHNPYAASASDSGSAVTSPALGYTAATVSPNPLTFDRLASSSNGHQTQQQQVSRHDRQQQQDRGDRVQGSRQITAEEVRQQMGNLLELAHSANGSAFLQAAIRGNHGDAVECIEIISAELLPHLGDLLLDSHGCYIIKTLMERMPTDQLQTVMINQIAPDESLVYSLCTHSLHTRRVVQFLLDTVDCTFLIDTITARCSEIATTQQGCIVVQRAMDVAVGPQKIRLFNAIQLHFNTFCFDPFANYVLQHMFSVGDPADVGRGVWPQIKGNVVALSCNKFASNVVEKCLSNLPVDLQHDLLQEMYDVPEERLLSMLQDSFGNYIIQTSIALAPQKDIPFMRTRLMAVLDRTPYGHKIESKLERRRKVNPKEGGAGNTAVAAGGLSGQTAANNHAPHVGHPTSNAKHNERAHQGHRGHRGAHKTPITPVAPVAEGEEPW